MCAVLFGAALWFLGWVCFRLPSHITLGALAVSHPGPTPQLSWCHIYWRNEWITLSFQEFGLIEGLTRTWLWGSLVTQLVKNPPAVQETRLNSWDGRSRGEGNSYPLQFSGLENSMDRGAWKATVRGVTKSQTWLSAFHIHFLSVIKIDSILKQRFS